MFRTLLDIRKTPLQESLLHVMIKGTLLTIYEIKNKKCNSVSNEK
jgi:hypothetical protein